MALLLCMQITGDLNDEYLIMSMIYRHDKFLFHSFFHSQLPASNSQLQLATRNFQLAASNSQLPTRSFQLAASNSQLHSSQITCFHSRLCVSEQIDH